MFRRKNWENEVREIELEEDEQEKKGNQTPEGWLAEVEYQLDQGFIIPLEKGEGKNALPTGMDVDTLVLDVEKDKEGEDNKEVYFVIGGLGESVEIMKPFLKELALQGKKVIAISVPGCGDSGDPNKQWREDEKGNPEKTFKNYSILIKRVLDKLGIKDKINVVGHSMGGPIIANFAKENSNIIKRVDLVAPAGYKKETTLGITPVKTTMKFTAANLRKILDQNLPAVVKEMWLKSFFGKSILNKIALEPRDKCRAWQRFWEGRVSAEGNLSGDIQEILKNNIPVKIIAGEKDEIFNIKDYEDMALKLEELNVENMKGKGHYGILDDSEKYAKQIIGKK